MSYFVAYLKVSIFLPVVFNLYRLSYNGVNVVKRVNVLKNDIIFLLMLVTINQWSLPFEVNYPVS